MKKRILALFIALTLVATLCPVTILAASELPPITYIDAAGQEQTRSGYKAITSTTVAWDEWCVVNSDVTISSRVTCNGNVKLILADGVTLTAEKGITVSGSGNSLTIYGQENGTGKLIATGASDNAGIGGINGQDGGNITIYCGDITAQGGFMGAGIGGGHNGIAENITIAGGKVTAIGGRYAAGIGGGYANESGKKVSNITISGGVVNASSTNEQGDLCGGAGIGGGSNEDADKITISGGDVTVTGGLFSAGIGGGCVGIAENITISGGKVTAIGGRYGAGIGGGYTNNSGKTVSNITISGGVVNASCTYFNEDQCGGAGIGGGNGEHADNITISGGKVTAASGKYGAGIGGGCGKDGTNIKFAGGTVTATAVHQGAGIGGGYNGKGSNINFTGGIVTATGCSDTSAVGNGYGCTSSSNIYATSSVVVNVGTSNPPNDTLTHTSEQDITSGLAGKQFASFKGTHTFSFNMQGHGTTKVDAQTISAGSKADKPADPSATGYSFKGWYKEAACENKWDFSTDTVDADTEVFADWKAKTATITIDAGGGISGKKNSVTGTYDSAMPALSSEDLPSYEGYTFAGFFDVAIGGKKYYNADGTGATNWDKDDATSTLYAQWTPSTDTPYTVEHYQQNVSDSGYTLKDTDHDSGTTGELTEASAKTTYEGFTAQTFSQETISAKGTTNVSIYYNRSIYTINFIVDGEITSDQYCKYGEFVAEPKAPEKEGYDFVGWFKESTCENEWDFSTDTTPASNTNLYADFEKSDEILFNEYKEAQKKELDKLGVDYGDVVKNAKESIDDLTFNPNKTLAENKALVDAVVSPVSKDLEDSRKSYAPKLVSGNKQSLDLNTATSASFKSEAPFDEFIKVTVDNKDVDKKYYSATAGSTIITLNNDFLGTLDTGEHTISIVSTNGHADGTFTITAQYTPPATGDAVSMILWVFFLAISMLGVFAFVFSRKNRL